MIAMAMKRVFKRLNVVKVTESPLKAAKYMEAGYEEITPKTQSEKQTKRKSGSGRSRAVMPVTKAGNEDGTVREIETPAESEQ